MPPSSTSLVCHKMKGLSFESAFKVDRLLNRLRVTFYFRNMSCISFEARQAGEKKRKKKKIVSSCQLLSSFRWQRCTSRHMNAAVTALARFCKPHIHCFLWGSLQAVFNHPWSNFMLLSDLEEYSSGASTMQYLSPHIYSCEHCQSTSSGFQLCLLL